MLGGDAVGPELALVTPATSGLFNSVAPGVKKTVRAARHLLGTVLHGYEAKVTGTCTLELLECHCKSALFTSSEIPRASVRSLMFVNEKNNYENAKRKPMLVINKTIKVMLFTFYSCQ